MNVVKLNGEREISWKTSSVSNTSTTEMRNQPDDYAATLDKRTRESLNVSCESNVREKLKRKRNRKYFSVCLCERGKERNEVKSFVSSVYSWETYLQKVTMAASNVNSSFKFIMAPTWFPSFLFLFISLSLFSLFSHFSHHIWTRKYYAFITHFI